MLPMMMMKMNLFYTRMQFAFGVFFITCKSLFKALSSPFAFLFNSSSFSHLFLHLCIHTNTHSTHTHSPCFKMWTTMANKREETTQFKLRTSVFQCVYKKGKKRVRRIIGTCSPHQLTKWALFFSLAQFSVLTETQHSSFLSLVLRS